MQLSVGGLTTTDPAQILTFLDRHENKVIFSTYQSLPVIIETIRYSKVIFDLIICDEAHKTAGIQQRLFGLVHDNKNIFAKKRLYMTATPRVISLNLRQQVSNNDKYIYDMNDSNIFGREIYRMSFKEAINKKLLVDYKIIAIGINDSQLRSFIEEKRAVNLDEITIVDWANNFAIENAMDKYKAKHAITFHSRILNAQNLANRHKRIFPKVKSFHVNGRQNTSKRSIILDQFINAQKSIIASARCLTEGIDVPRIDLIYFCDRKYSKIEIIQAIGRVLRLDKTSNKKFGYIVVPIFHIDKSQIEAEISKSQFRNLVTIIRSLSDQDERLRDEINYIAYKNSRHTECSENIKQSMTLNNLLFSDELGEQLRSSIFNQIIKKTSCSWDITFLKFKEYIEINRDYPTKFTARALYIWAKNQRDHRKKGTLTFKQIKILNSINFIWEDNKDDSWEVYFQKLKTYRLTHDYEPSKGDNNDLYNWITIQKFNLQDSDYPDYKRSKILSLNFKGRDLDRIWNEKFQQLKIHRSKHDYPPTMEEDPILCEWFKAHKKYRGNDERLKGRKQKLLELNFKEDPNSIVWRSTNLNNWNKQFNSFIKYLDLNNNKCPSQRNTEPVAHRLAVWLLKIRSDYRNGKLSEHKLTMLRGINFHFEPLKYRWEKSFALLQSWIKENNAFPNSKTNKLLFGWLKFQSNKYLSNSLNQAERKSLEDINVGQFIENLKEDTYRNKSWEQNYTLAKSYYEKYNKLPSHQKEGINLEEKMLGLWVSNQNDKKTKLTRKQKMKLKELNIEVNFINIKSWDESFQELSNFYKNNNRWPLKTERRLWQWCSNQRYLFNNSTEQPNNKYFKERKEKLSSINFPWNKKNEKWEVNFEKLKNYMKKNRLNEFIIYNDCKDSTLNQWLSQQKSKYKANKLNKNKYLRLKEIGIEFIV
ncbi:DEAD/DEAH box helicase [Leptospira santarosai]|uniref:Helicase associated domain protein n=1 Tax=Leptospira santarosai str. ZUN179 TaxID=1049985 RepID=M6UPU8_9LEPT|nr:helicase associated domain-containing protein [Leptospira santarosai]EMO46600.1 helicase associated domain protein [Leptospira santarosai str. ZUN179]